MHDIEYGYRYPAIRAITNLQQMRDQGSVSIAFDRVGYDADDVEESSIYVYVGKCGEHTGWVSDDAPYGPDLVVSGGYILPEAFKWTSSVKLFPAEERTVVPQSLQVVLSADPETTLKYLGSDLQNATGGGSSLSGYFNGDKYYGKWRKVTNLKNKTVSAYFAESTNESSKYRYKLSCVSAYQVNRRSGDGRQVFANPSGFNTELENREDILKRFSKSISLKDYYDYRFGVFGESYDEDENQNTVVVELGLDELFCVSGGDYRNKYQEHYDLDKTVNLDFNPHTLQPEISSKDKDKLEYNIFHGKTPIFFMIAEKLKCSYYGLTNFYFASSSDKKSLKVISSKKQVVADRLYNAGDIYGTISVGGNGSEIERIVVDLAQGDGYNPSYENNKRRVWVTTTDGRVKSYDYWSGELKSSARPSTYPIRSVAINPKNGDCVFVRVSGNTKNNFLQVCRMRRDSSTVEILAPIPDYAQDVMPRYPMTGGKSEAYISEHLYGGVISRESSDSNTLWFTFIVNAENTISVQLDGPRKILWADRMHYGMWHGANAYGIYKNSNSTYPAIKHATYVRDREYGVPANQENVRGIATTIVGNTYVNGHTYLHFDDTRYKKYSIIGVHYKDRTWSYGSRDDLWSCGHYFSDNYRGDDDNFKYWSYVFDYNTGKWSQDAAGYAILEKRLLNEMGWPAPDADGQHYRFAVKDSNSGMSWDVLSKEIGPKLGKDIGGDHWCRMSWNAETFQDKKADDIKEMRATVGDFPPLKPGQKTGLVKPGVVFSQEKGTVKFGGSGYGVHMGSTKKAVDVGDGNFGYKPLNVGFIYNAEAYNFATSASNYSGKPVFSTNRDDSDENFFKASTSLAEDDPSQKGVSARPSGDMYNFNVEAVNAPPAIPTSDFLVQKESRGNSDKAEGAKLFSSKFGYVEIESPWYIDPSIVPDGAIRCGFCEDAYGFDRDHPAHRWYGNITNGKGISTYNAFSALSSNLDNKMYGLEETLTPHGNLQKYGRTAAYVKRYLYQTTRGKTDINGGANGIVRLTYSGTLSPTVANSGKANPTNDFPSSVRSKIETVYIDDTNGLWGECDGSAMLKTKAAPADAQLSSYWFVGDQLTNLGHNKCSSPYFEYTAYKKNVTGVVYGYEQYAGAKKYAQENAPTGQKMQQLADGVSDVSVSGIGAPRYNDDPVGMRALKALGYCWTKSTKAHPTDVYPSGRLYIVDHYVIEDNACKFMDKIYLDMDKSRTSSMEISISSIPTSADFVEWRLEYTHPIASGGDAFLSSAVVHPSGFVITSGKYVECSAASAIVVRTSGDGFSGYEYRFGSEPQYVSYHISASMQLASSFDMSAATVTRPMNGLPRVSKSFWDYSTDEGIMISGDSDEAAAVDAYEYLHMLHLPPMYLSDASTIIGNPVAFRCAGYDKLYTAHLASIYDAGTYEINNVSIWFSQNPDIDYTKNKKRYEMRTYGPTELSSITIRDKEGTPTFGRDTIIARSNRQLNDVLDDSNVVFNHYRDTYCLSADTVWDSVNAYGKPQGIGPLSGATSAIPASANIAGWPLSAVYGQTCPRQWYGTEVYRHSNYAGDSESRISLMHSMNAHINKQDQSLPAYMSGYGVHPSVYPEESKDLATVSALSGVWVENAALGINGDAHVVGGSFTTNEYAYVDERENPSAITVDMGKNYVYVFERWPTQYWYPICTDSRGGLSLFGDCPKFEDED